MRPTSSRSSRPIRRHTIAAVIFWMLPLLAFAGVIAPNAVRVAYEQKEEEIAQRSGRVVFRPVRLSRPPLVIPRDQSEGFLPQLIDLEGLFRGEQYRGEAGRKLASLPSFPSSRGDSIVIDDVDTAAADDFFRDLLRPTFVADEGPVWDPKIFDVIPPLFKVGNDVRFDDFPEPGIDVDDAVPVPEPHTGALLGLSLAYLAYAGRRRR